MEFPHLKDSKFPHLNNVDVYKYQNVFDYSRWKGKVSIKLLNVLWNSNYADVPGFSSEAERDAWFDSKNGVSTILESGFNITPENEVRIPIPYNDAYRFNYMVVDMPMQTGTDNPIDYENANTRVKRWYYFVDSLSQIAPNTTELLVSLDVWTTFYNTVEIPYLMLERGHAPMMQTSVEQFLSNPIANNEYLLADDFNFGNDTVISSTNYVPINNGKKFVLFFMSLDKISLQNFIATDSWQSGATSPTFSNEEAYPNDTNRWGYQYHVDGYDWHYGAADYSGANLPIKTGLIQSGLMSGLECFAIDGDSAYEFFNTMAHKAVHFIHAIQAVFVLADNMFKKSDSFEFMGYTLYIADRLHQSIDINLTKEVFNYPIRYADITKLYTSPYAILEVTDDYNNTFSAKIENISSLRMYSVVSLVYPFLNFVSFVAGIGGSGSVPYSWQNINSEATNLNEYASDFEKFMFRWDVPTYSLFVSQEQEHASNSFADIQAKREGALVDYRNSVRYANNTRENVEDSMDVYEQNVKATNQTNADNTKNMALTVRQNAYRSADTDKTNADNNANNMVTNQGVQNGANTTITAENTAKNSAIRSLNNVAANDAVAENNKKIYADVAQDNSLCYATSIQIQNAAIAATTAANSGNAMAQGALNAVDSLAGAIGSGLSGNVGGAVQGAIGTATSLISTGFNVANANAVSSIQIGVNIDTVAVTQAANNAKAGNAADCNLAQTRISNALTADTNNQVNEAMTNNTATQNTASLTQTVNTSNTLKTNAGNIQSTEKTNAENIRTQTNANAAALQTTNDANVERMTNTEKNNALYTRNATIRAAQDNLRQKQREVRAGYVSARLQKPAQYGNYAGDGVPDAIARRGIRFNVRTQTKAAIAQAGDAMLRFGYALHRVWDMSNGLHYGKYFTFWKAEDIWINEGSGLAGNAVNIIGDIFLKGVTVWRNPDKIGKISIYDNI